MNDSLLNNRYRILGQIGSGGFGFTYLGEDLGFPNHPKCVIKMLRPQAADDSSLALAAELFQREAETLHRLGRHPNIPSLVAHFRDRGQFFLVQEFIEGQTLESEFRTGRRFDQHDAIQLLGQILETLVFVHGQNVIHRDVKPANIIRRNGDGSLALIDFGAVKLVNSGGIDQSAVGSRGYMPVEQIAGKPVFGSDLYALGLVAIEGMTGIRPLDLPKDGRTLEFDWAGRAPVAQEFAGFLSALVRRNARDRFFSAREALSALNSVAARAGFFQGQRAATVRVGAAPAAAAEIPPTVIVSPQQRLIRPAVERTPEPSPGNGRLAKIALGFGAIAFIFAILHFAGIGSRPTTTDRPQSTLPKAEAQTPLASSIDAFTEAREQAEEARAMEADATTRHEWEEISNKYRRAYLLFSSVPSSHKKFADAQPLIEYYRKESDRARDTANRISDK